MNKKFIFLLFILTLLVLINFSYANEKTTYTIGYYEDNPLVFKNDDGQPDGFFIDLMKYIDKTTKYDFKYTFDIWPEQLRKVKNGEIDILLNIAQSDERLEFLSYNNEPIFLSLGRIFIHSSENIQSMLDLENKKIGYLKDDIFAVAENGLLEELKAFNIHADLITYNNYTEIFNAIDNKELDAGLVTDMNSFRLKKYKNIKSSPILIRPSHMYLSTKKNSNRELIRTIDEKMTLLKQNPESYYYERLDHWHSLNKDASIMPLMEEYSVYIIVILFIIIAIFIFLRYQINQKTKEIQRINDSLEEKVEKRTRNLNATINKLISAKNDLAEVKKMASLRELIIGLSHELNTPLGNIRTSTDFLSNQNDKLLMEIQNEKCDLKTLENFSDNLREIIRLIESSIRHVNRLIDNFKSMKENTTVMPFEEININEFIENIISMYSVQNDNLIVNIDLKTNSSNLVAFVPKNQLEFIIFELINNVLLHAYTSEDDYKIDFVLREEDENNLCIIIKNYGKKIPEKHLERIYDPFFTTKQNRSSIGLGLFSVFNIVKNILHGNIECISTDESTEFIITLPKNLPEN